jgi:hypothetical protein
MDMRDFSVPTTQQPRLRGAAEECINGINAQMAWAKHHKKPEEVIRIYYGGAFGILQAVRISPEGTDFLRIVVKDEGGTAHQIVAPVSQCSFMLSLAVPTTEEPEEKVIFGFGEPQKD